MENTKLFKEIFKKTFSLFRRHWFCFTRISAAFFIPFLVFDRYFFENQIFIDKIIAKYSLAAFVIIDDVINLVLLIFFLLYLAAIIKAIYTADQGKKPRAIASCGYALHVLGSYLWIKTLFAFKVLCWSLLLIIPGIIAAIYYGFASMAFIVDGKRGREALVFSKIIIKPNIKQYLLGTSGISVAFLAVCASIVFNLDSLIAFYKLRGNIIMAELIDYGEIVFVAWAGIIWLISYYYLYRELREKQGAV